MRLMSDCAWPEGDRSGGCKDDHGGMMVEW
jgi:hypothetical protein